MAKARTQIVLGRGKVYFEPFFPGTLVGDGERYIGNTPSFQIDREIEVLPKFTSYGGRKVELPGLDTTETNEVSFSTDHINLENVGLWYGSTAEETTVIGINLVTEQFTARPGRFYQLGMSAYGYAGTRGVTTLTVRYDGEIVPMDGNYLVDNASGRLELLPTTTIPRGALFEVSFEWKSSYQEIVQSEPVAITGALRFIAANVAGTNRNHFFPCVKLLPRGVLDMKGDTFQQLSFTAPVYAKGPGIKQIYVDSISAILYTSDEQAIINDGLSLDAFVGYEDMLDIIVNTDLPEADLGQVVTYP